MENYEIPMGFGMALAQNPEAMMKFSSLPESKKREIINGTHSVTSKSEMKRYVEKIISLY
ncbi:MAG: YdeI/OmpD-associated family protein [Oscillospiraceae bacterium]